MMMDLSFAPLSVCEAWPIRQTTADRAFNRRGHRGVQGYVIPLSPSLSRARESELSSLSYILSCNLSRKD
jgi:hypothetical protein